MGGVELNEYRRCIAVAGSLSGQVTREFIQLDYSRVYRTIESGSL